MTPNTWVAVPASNTLSDLNPQNDPALNPVYPAKPEFMGTHANIILAWCGACNDDAVLWLPLSGGHADYGGNEPYKIDLNAETPSWEMVRPPSGAIGNVITTDDGQEATGLYSDGRPRAIHSYNKPVYVPGVGPVIAVQGSTWTSGQAGTKKPIFISPTTGEMTGFYDPPTDAAGTASGSGACYDSSRNAIWWRGSGTSKFQKFDIGTQAWTSHGSNIASNGNLALVYLADHDCIVWFRTFPSPEIAIFDCTTGTIDVPPLSGSMVGASIGGTMQPVYVPAVNAIACWDNSTDTTKINILSVPANPKTDTWVISQLPVDAANAVTPSAKAANGTYGRFFYSQRLDGFGVINAASEPIYFYARS